MTSSSTILQAFLPPPITNIVVNYLEDLSQAEFIRDSFLPNKTEYHRDLAKELLSQFNLAETKSPQKKLTRVKAEGVANALCYLNAAQLACLFNEWQSTAEAEEDENGTADFCSRHRLLIGYYMSTTLLRTPTYGMNKVEGYLQKLQDKKQVPLNDKLIHALYVKFAVAHNDVEKVHELLKISSACLNLLDADLSNITYNFTAIDFSYACLKNVKLGPGFFSIDGLLVLSSVNKANLENSIYEEITYPLESLDNLSKLSHAAAGLDIRYTESHITALHIYGTYAIVDNKPFSDLIITGREMLLNLLHHGANPKVADRDGDDTYDINIKFYKELLSEAGKFISHARFKEQINGYNLLIASLSTEDLNQQKNAVRKIRNRQLFMLSIWILLFIFLSTLCLTSGFIFSCIPLPNVIPLTTLFTCLSATLGGIFALSLGVVLVRPLINTIRGIIPLIKTIDQHQLANNNVDYKTHLLLKRILASPIDWQPEKLLTLDDQILFDSLSKDDLERQKQINHQARNDEFWNGLRYILIGLVFAALTVAGDFGLFSLIPSMALGTLGTTSTLHIIGISTFLTTSFTSIMASTIVGLELIYTGFTSFFTSHSTKNAIDQLINRELSTREFDKPEPTPAPQLVPAKKVEVLRAASASPAKVVDVSVFNRASPQESNDETNVALLHTLNLF